MDLQEYKAKVAAHLDLNSKVHPRLYNSIGAKDLGLCFATFCTEQMCAAAERCPWRHACLTESEANWIIGLGEEKFIRLAARRWMTPNVACRSSFPGMLAGEDTGSQEAMI